MIELRWLKIDDKKTLQWRWIPLQIGESSCGDWVVEPQPPVSMRMENNWSEWEQIPIVEITDTQETDP